MFANHPEAGNVWTEDGVEGLFDGNCTIYGPQCEPERLDDNYYHYFWPQLLRQGS